MSETTSATRIRVMIVDDHELVRSGLEAILDVIDDVDLVAEAESGDEAVALCDEARPDVVLMDLVMPHMDGATATREILRRRPGTRVLALTSFSDPALIQEVLKAGAIGCLLKNVTCDELAQAIRRAHAGAATLAPEAAGVLINAVVTPPQPDVSLTPREREVMGLLVQGLTNTEIAEPAGGESLDGQDPREQHPHQARGVHAHRGGGHRRARPPGLTRARIGHLTDAGRATGRGQDPAPGHPQDRAPARCAWPRPRLRWTCSGDAPLARRRIDGRREAIAEPRAGHADRAEGVDRLRERRPSGVLVRRHQLLAPPRTRGRRAHRPVAGPRLGLATPAWAAGAAPVPRRRWRDGHAHQRQSRARGSGRQLGEGAHVRRRPRLRGRGLPHRTVHLQPVPLLRAARGAGPLTGQAQADAAAAPARLRALRRRLRDHEPGAQVLLGPLPDGRVRGAAAHARRGAAARAEQAARDAAPAARCCRAAGMDVDAA